MSADPPEDPQAHRRTLWLLGLGATIGLTAAAASIVLPTGDRSQEAPTDAVALVNEDMIRRDDYLRLLAGFEADSKGPVDAETRAHILDRMIDEELLVQRALDLGLAQIDRRVRADLTNALISSIVSTAEDREPEPDELARFYDDQRDFFTRPGRLHVRQVFFRVPTGANQREIFSRAHAAKDALRGGAAIESLRETSGDAEVSPLPDTLLPALKLREYLGPKATRAAAALQPGEVSDPIRSGVGIHVLQMVDRTPDVSPPLAEIEPQVRNEWRRRSGDRALRAYLDQLREDGDVEVLIDFEN